MSKSVLLIVTGSIAAYKSLEVIRQLRSLAINVTVILSKGGSEFVTPLSLAALSGNQVYSDLFSLQDESEMGHIRLSREHDLIAVIPASANIIAKIANGLCDDLASTTLLASNKPIIIAPAMNSFMWNNSATLRNIKQLQADGIEIIEPAAGELACGEVGEGKLASVENIVERIADKLQANQPLKGLSALVTAGPTFEPIDPVRFIGNRSSGKQGYAIAAALANAGAKVTLIKGETAEAPPLGIDIINVETAEQMLAACKNALPVDIGVFCAAVADWKVKNAHESKLKKRANQTSPQIELTPNPDILKTIATLKQNRPKMIIGFAAETEAVEKNALGKLKSKNCDMVVANDVSGSKVFGKDCTSAYFMTAKSSRYLPDISKKELALELVEEIKRFFGVAN